MRASTTADPHRNAVGREYVMGEQQGRDEGKGEPEGHFGGAGSMDWIDAASRVSALIASLIVTVAGHFGLRHVRMA